jgi:hypothetical protein
MSMVVRPKLDPRRTQSQILIGIPIAMRPNDVAQALDLDRIAKDHVWKVEPSCATSGEGKKQIHALKSRHPESHADTFQQVSSKASPGSARTSRSRRSKRGPFSHYLYPTTHARYHQHYHNENQQHCTTIVPARTSHSLPRRHVQHTLHDRPRSHWIPRISRRRTKT